MTTIRSKVSLVLDLPPACAQFCPPHPHLLVIGTYNLEKQQDGSAVEGAEDTAAERNGSLIVFSTDGSSLTRVQTEAQPSAILDLRFHPAQGRRDVVAVISSTGTLAIFRVEDSDRPLQHLATSRCDDLAEDVLFLQCQWHPGDAYTLGVTTSSGLVRMLHLDSDWKIASHADLDIDNSLEAWSIAFAPDPSTSTTVYSGGDDSVLSPVSVKGQHGAGVTAIEPLNLHDLDGSRLVITGSYDDRIRLFSICDPPQSYGMKKVKLLMEENLDGGVWRLDVVDVVESGDGGGVTVRILVSCMYAGARLVRIFRDANGGEWKCGVLGRFEEHESMNYASAVVPGSIGGGGGELTCISTSFYDKKLCLWDYR
ncbi:diphthine methyl ester acylhydrolase [Geosmithia morbida]|uniref:Diphthine methyl ester acylhydrolase n=1 Tax=Geosmithia morbida TaxID=1094350 RepID=A0A9P4YRS3_9HYPO|nr:diphthine methyl ester acylhydrolase [Geosmithia morbida]KAF4121545.1 diphthine methyl ester acylhydrolase [Geosmithia morbida]